MAGKAKARFELIRFERNSDGYRQILRSNGVKSDLEERARRVAASASDMYNPADNILAVKVDSYKGKSRAGATVVAIGDSAMQVEADRRVLGTAINSGR